MGRLPQWIEELYGLWVEDAASLDIYLLACVKERRTTVLDVVLTVFVDFVIEDEPVDGVAQLRRQEQQPARVNVIVNERHLERSSAMLTLSRSCGTSRRENVS